MCGTTCPISERCRQIADLEYELEQLLCDTPPLEKEYALTLLRKRGDSRAAGILEEYLGPRAPLDSAIGDWIVPALLTKEG